VALRYKLVDVSGTNRPIGTDEGDKTAHDFRYRERSCGNPAQNYSIRQFRGRVCSDGRAATAGHGGVPGGDARRSGSDRGVGGPTAGVVGRGPHGHGGVARAFHASQSTRGGGL
jgi:hypothetical protein